MGMYTGLRGTVVVKQEYVSKISMLVNDGADWEDILPSDNLYNNYSRNSFIPFGAVCYMPDDWDKEAKLSGDKFTFCCSLKDYKSTIRQFITHCLPEIAESWTLEELYEEDSQPTIHTKLQGE